MIGLASVLNDLLCPGPAAPGVDVLEAGQCCPGDAFSSTEKEDGFREGFLQPWPWRD